MNLAIIIPALNEEGSIASTLSRLPDGLAQQVIVVDNGSTDATAERARQAGATVVGEPRRGYGQACRTGLAHLREDIDAVAILDADGSDDSSRLPEMVGLIARGDADFVLGARVLGGARQCLSPPQRFGNWLACRLMRLVVGHRYRDCGPMRVIRRDALDRLQMRDPTWGWNVEMQIKAARHGLRIRELPVTYAARVAGQSKISGSVLGTLRAGVKIVATIAHHAVVRGSRSVVRGASASAERRASADKPDPASALGPAVAGSPGRGDLTVGTDGAVGRPAPNTCSPCHRRPGT